MVFLLLTALAFGLGGRTGSAQSFVRIESRTRPGWQVHLEWDTVSVSDAPAGWWSADWVFEPTGATNTYRIKNRYRGTYLNMEAGPLVASNVPAAFVSSQWNLEPMGRGYYRIRNAWKGVYLNVANAFIDAGPQPGNWETSHWRLPGLVPGGEPAVITGVDPSCLVEVPWVVQPEAVDIRLIGCRAGTALAAPDAEGWRHYADPKGGSIETRFAGRDSVSGSVVFLVRVNGGGSGTFSYQVTGIPNGDGILKAGTFTAKSAPVGAQPEAAAMVVDPACLATVAWVVQPEGDDIRLTGCRPASALPAPNQDGWRSYVDSRGQTIETRGEERDPATGALFFTVRWNGGGSATFAYEVRGVPTADGVLKAGTFTVKAPRQP
jgi:hypothetical protein